MHRNNFPINKAIAYLQRMTKKWQLPPVSQLARKNRNPFHILIATLLSSRTKDEVTAAAGLRLFKKADSPEKILTFSEEQIARLIYPVGFYNTKARLIKKLCKILVEQHQGKVPADLSQLLKLPGVGRKTATLVLSLAFNKPEICVDTHVHRICNRWGIVKTSTPAETENALQKILPRRYWIKFNSLLVPFGQNICKPTSPLCSQCGLLNYCPQIGVTRKR